MGDMKDKLEKLASKNKIGKIIKISEGKDKEAALEAIASLGHTTGEDGKNYLVRTLSHPDAAYRASAAKALAILGDTHYKAAISQAFQKETDAATKEIMKESMSAIKDY